MLSFSSLKAFSKSPSHYLAYKARVFKSTPAMDLGTAVHCAILEPERFDNEYVLADGRKGSKAHTAQLEAGKTILTPAVFDSVNNMVLNFNNHEFSKGLIDGALRREFEIQGEINNHKFRGFVDAGHKDYLIDIKTTKNGDPRDFTNDVYRAKYHLQAAIYCELTGVSDYWIIAIENVAPYTVTSYLLSQELKDKGLEELYYLLSQFEKWDGKPQGYVSNDDYLKLNLPSWA